MKTVTIGVKVSVLDKPDKVTFSQTVASGESATHGPFLLRVFILGQSAL